MIPVLRSPTKILRIFLSRERLPATGRRARPMACDGNDSSLNKHNIFLGFSQKVFFPHNLREDRVVEPHGDRGDRR